MLTVWGAIEDWRSIRKFALDDVPDEMIEQILGSGQTCALREQTSTVALYGGQRTEKQAGTVPYMCRVKVL